MGTYIVADEHTYIVKKENLDKAVAFLDKWTFEGVKATPIVTKVGDVAFFDGRYVLDGKQFAPFDGELPWSWDTKLKEFIERYCEEGTNCAFRNDDEFEWYLWWKDGSGVHSECRGIYNPFWERQRDMNRKSGI